MALLLMVGVAGCGSGSPQAATAPRLTSVTVAMGYFQNVQFAPFYVAQARGYYRRAGLYPHFQYTIEPQALRLLSAGKVDFVDSGGDEVLLAGAEGLRVKYVMTQYARFPAALFYLTSSGIRRVSDLRGRTVGTPAFYGASYIGLRALLQAAHVPYARVHVVSTGFAQMAAVATHKVDAAMGYAMNEPIALRAQGKAVGEFDVYRWDNLAGAGMATSDAMIAKHPAVVRAFVTATLRGLRDTLQNPAAALAITLRAVPTLHATKTLQAQILKRCLTFWSPAGGALGSVKAAVWQRTAAALVQFGEIHRAVHASAFYTNRFVSGSR